MTLYPGAAREKETLKITTNATPKATVPAILLTFVIAVFISISSKIITKHTSYDSII
jgi:hypothetical protein